MMEVHVDLATCGQRNAIDVRFAYSREAVTAIKTVAGARWVPSGKHWHVPLDMASCRALREAFGDDLFLGASLRSWAVQAKRDEDQLGSLAQADTATLTRLPEVLPELYRCIHLGPLGLQMTDAEKQAAMEADASYQAADVAFLANAPAWLNGNHPGLGKTIETIASVWESGRERGDHLVICPATAIEAVWVDELLKWQAEAGDDVAVFAPVGTKAQRAKIINAFLLSEAPVRWLVVNPEMVRYKKDPTHTAPKRLPAKGSDPKGACYCEARDAHYHYEAANPELHSVKWSTIIVDECHKNSIRNHRSITSISIGDLSTASGAVRGSLSGTPMRKKGGSDMWGILHWLRPDVFTSYWRFVESYFEIEDNGYGKRVGDLRTEREKAMFKDLAPYLLRRTKAECLPWLPAKQFIDVECEMDAKQRTAYLDMLQDGFATLGDQEVSTTSILAERTRLRQFATTLCTVKDGEVEPSLHSCKLDAMLDKMDEYGLFDGNADSPHVVFTQSKKLCYLVVELLRSKGLRVEALTGDQNKPGERKALKDKFQGGAIDVLCIVTTAGGVALTLDAADVVHFLDETESPDDQEQAEDRVHRASRNHQVQILRYRTKNTIDELIADSNFDKKSSHEIIMDLRRLAGV